MHSFLHFSRAKDEISHLLLTPTERIFLMEVQENECQISQEL